jgi:hypothetical protein
MQYAHLLKRASAAAAGGAAPSSVQQLSAVPLIASFSLLWIYRFLGNARPQIIVQY